MQNGYLSNLIETELPTIGEWKRKFNQTYVLLYSIPDTQDCYNIYTHTWYIYPDTKIAISIKWTENRKSLCFDLTRKNRLANQSIVQHDISHQWCYTFYTDEIPLIHEIQRIPSVLIAIWTCILFRIKKEEKRKKKYKNFLSYKNVQNNSSSLFHVKFNAIQLSFTIIFPRFKQYHSTPFPLQKKLRQTMQNPEKIWTISIQFQQKWFKKRRNTR